MVGALKRVFPSESERKQSSRSERITDSADRSETIQHIIEYTWGFAAKGSRAASLRGQTGLRRARQRKLVWAIHKS